MGKGLGLRNRAIQPASDSDVELRSASSESPTEEADELDPEGWSVWRNDTGQTFSGKLGGFDVQYWPYRAERSVPNHLAEEMNELGFVWVRPVSP